MKAADASTQRAGEIGGLGMDSADPAAGIRRVKRAQRPGIPVGNRLSAEQGKCLLRTGVVASLRSADYLIGEIGERDASVA